MEIAGSPIYPINGSIGVSVGGAERSNTNTTFNFWLPSSWRTGSVQLVAEIDPFDFRLENNEGNNSFSITRTFGGQEPICIVTRPVRTNGSNFTTASAGFWPVMSRFETLWPLSDFRYFQVNSRMERPCGFLWLSSCPWELPGQSDELMFHLITWNTFTSNPAGCNSSGAYTHYMGMVSPDTNTGNNLGYANYAIGSSYVKMESAVGSGFNSARGGATMAQELAHNYNGVFGNRWKHVNCGNPGDLNPNYPYPGCQIAQVGTSSFYGYDRISNQVIAPNAAADYMSYGGTKWVSDYTWRGLQNRAAVSAAQASASAAVERVLASQEMLVIGGIITSTTPSAILFPAYRIPPDAMDLTKLKQAVEAQFVPRTHAHAGAIPSYTLEFLDAQSGLLATEPVTPTEAFEHSPSQVLFVTVPYQPGTSIIRLLQDGQELARLGVSANAPTVQITSPNGGETINGPLTIEWTAADADQDPLYYLIQYSVDGGTNWQILSSMHPTTSFVLSDTSTLQGSSQARIRVTASDGVNTGADESDANFTVTDKSPLAHINSPEADGSVQVGDVQVTGGAYDPEDGNLGDAALSWKLNGQSAGTGQELILSGLEPGLHTVELTATDSQNNQATVSRTFQVFGPLYLPAIIR